jgi:hypothetical protein
MMAFDADKFLKVAVGVGVLMAGSGVGYHFGVYLPQIERMKVERSDRVARERQELADSKERERKARYDSCLQEAIDAYETNWSNACKINGLNNKSADCSLPRDSADRLEKFRKSDEESCLEEFKLGV